MTSIYPVLRPPVLCSVTLLVLVLHPARADSESSPFEQGQQKARAFALYAFGEEGEFICFRTNVERVILAWACWACLLIEWTVGRAGWIHG